MNNESDKTMVASALKLLAPLLAGYIIGYFNDARLAGVLIACLAVIAWHYFQYLRFHSWLFKKQMKPIPYGAGIWPDLYARVQHFRERKAEYQQQSQQQQEAKLRFVESLPNAAFVLNSDFEILMANKWAIELFDTKDDLSNRPISNYLRQPNFITYLESGEYESAPIIMSPHDPMKSLQCVMSFFGESQWLLQLVDISLQVKALQMREDFVANASHELRTPITVMRGYLDSLVDEPTIPTEWHDPIQQMSEQLNRMQALVADLLALNVLETAGPAQTNTAVNIAETIYTIQHQIEKSCGSQKNFLVDIQSNMAVLGVESEIHSVVSNLVSNALRFTPQDGQVVARWIATEEGANLVIEDNGTGIATDELPRITERFYRTDRGRANHRRGTGLGLAIVKHALARHDAELQIESELGLGSKFTCKFPSERLTSTA